MGKIVMQFLADTSDWVITNVLEPFLGEWWAEITFLIIFILCSLLVAFSITLIIKFIKLKKQHNNSDSELAHFKSINIKLSDDIRYLKSDKQNLEKTLSYVRKELEARAKLFEDLEKENKDLSTRYEKSLEEINILDKKIKRSESAKKAAETRKKNKEKLLDKVVD